MIKKFEYFMFLNFYFISYYHKIIFKKENEYALLKKLIYVVVITRMLSEFKSICIFLLSIIYL